MTELARTELGTVSVTPRALSSLVVRSAESVEGARVRRPRRRLAIEVGDGSARVSLELAVARGRRFPDVARAVQERVDEALRTMLGVRVAAVDVAVEEVDR